MKIVIQKVKEAKVIVDEKIVGEIGLGYCLLVGIEKSDTLPGIKRAADKITTLRLFDDKEGKINLSIKDVEGSILSISQFTLAGDIKKGNRPSFTNAMSPDIANELYESFNKYLEDNGIKVEKGIFQTHMNVIINNDGPITMIMEVKDGKVL
ncbi:MAG: D-tyrosyl-tRNA(Tyr) deacylase [Erysipelothrix sp.]|nr:D-tyrosyl-tRNA(Tyr) deacylase [Erysipelothrix sp.]